jgi:tetratricopeptide (TPR) repeat protein
MAWGYRFLAFVFSTLVLAGPVAANVSDDCDQTSDIDRSIRGCTLIIEGKAKGRKDYAFNTRALAYRKKNEYDKALTDYTRAIELNPRYGTAFLNRGVAYHDKGEYDRALADYTRAIELDPKDADAYNNLGNIYSELGEYDRAIIALNRAIELSPKYTGAYMNRGNAYRDRSEFKRAIADFTRAIELNPKSGKTYSNRGIAYQKKGEFEQALADFNKAIEVAPYTFQYRSRSTYFLEQGKTDQALADASQALQLNAETPENFVARAKAYEAKGLRELAIADYRDALLKEAHSVAEKDASAEAQSRLAALTATPAMPPQIASVAAPSAPETAKVARPYGRRVALVIGNSKYASVSDLANPANDARLLAVTLRRLGFAEVIERHDLDFAAFTAAIKEFGDKSADADWAVVYYAGHGIEMNGVPYLIPVDAKLLRDTHVTDEALPLERVLLKVETAKKLRLVILDACRNNPFASRMVRTTGLNRSIGQGLTAIEPEGGVLVAYAAKHGTVAQDGEGANSPFASALANFLAERDLEIQFLFRKVRDRVMSETGGKQEPFLYGSLGAEPLYFQK